MKQLLLIILLLISSLTFSQSKPIIYFCEKYDGTEINISDRFTTGNLTIIIKSDDIITYTDVFIEYDKYNSKTKQFEYYKKISYKLGKNQRYMRITDSRLSFNETGIFRVFILNSASQTITSSLIEII